MAYRVLVLDDEESARESMREALESGGYEVVTSSTAPEALEAQRAFDPDVIVSDVNMPGMTGIAMVRALRAEPLMAEVRVLMLTSEASIETETEGLEAGADDYILKPVEPRRLAARVQSLLARSKTRAA